MSGQGTDFDGSTEKLFGTTLWRYSLSVCVCMCALLSDSSSPIPVCELEEERGRKRRGEEGIEETERERRE